MSSGITVFESSGVDLQRLEELGRRFAGVLRPGDVVFLCGPLGAGKTAFVRAVARALEVADPVRSPSFTLANIYQGRLTLQHLDLYRLERVEEEDALGLEDYVESGAVTMVEWPEVGVSRLGIPTWTVFLDHESLETRTVRMEARDEETARRWVGGEA